MASRKRNNGVKSPDELGAELDGKLQLPVMKAAEVKRTIAAIECEEGQDAFLAYEKDGQELHFGVSADGKTVAKIIVTADEFQRLPTAERKAKGALASLAIKKLRDALAQTRQRRETFTRSLRVDLSDSEVLDRSSRAARLVEERDAMEEALKDYSKHQKALIGEKDSEIRRLSSEVRSRTTYRATDCERVFDYARGNVVETRLDTGEQLNERAMVHEERQQELDLTENAANDLETELDDTGAAIEGEQAAE